MPVLNCNKNSLYVLLYGCMLDKRMIKTLSFQDGFVFSEEFSKSEQEREDDEQFLYGLMA